MPSNMNVLLAILLVVGGRESRAELAPAEDAPPRATATEPVTNSTATPADESAREKSPPPTPSEIQAWIAELAHDRFDVRETATRRLAGAGEGAIAPLEQSALGPSLEATCRAIRALAGIAQRAADRTVFEAAQEALERLVESNRRSVARRAAVALQGLSEARRRHAISRVLELGAIIKPPIYPKGIPITEEERTGASHLILGKRWKGGDEGLVHLRRIDELRVLFIIKGSGISDEALAGLQEALPDLRIQHRGEAMLGVSFSANGNSCIVDGITPGSAAEKAGLEPGDLVTSYDGEEIMTFERLIEITGKHSAGDKVILEVIRGGRILKLEAILDEWR
ncbi:MAG: PDZ domain-containing protein [Planctomycetales bacterium]